MSNTPDATGLAGRLVRDVLPGLVDNSYLPDKDRRSVVVYGSDEDEFDLKLLRDGTKFTLLVTSTVTRPSFITKLRQGLAGLLKDDSRIVDVQVRVGDIDENDRDLTTYLRGE